MKPSLEGGHGEARIHGHAFAVESVSASSLPRKTCKPWTRQMLTSTAYSVFRTSRGQDMGREDRGFLSRLRFKTLQFLEIDINKNLLDSCFCFFYQQTDSQASDLTFRRNILPETTDGQNMFMKSTFRNLYRSLPLKQPILHAVRFLGLGRVLPSRIKPFLVFEGTFDVITNSRVSSGFVRL
jgi:hypothetical protein